MALVSDRCICLRKVEYSETSQILLLFGRERGAVRVIAKGAHRVTKAGASKFGGGLDHLDLGQATFTDRVDKDLATLTEWRLLDGHLELRRSLRAVHLAFYAAELVGVLLEEHDPHPELFDRLEVTLTELATNRAEQAFLAFELDLLRETGFLPDLYACGNCRARVDARSAGGFSADAGAVLCRNCAATFPSRLSFDPRLLGVLQHFEQMLRAAPAAQGNGARRLPALTRHQTDPINRLLADYVQHTLGRRLRLTRHVLGGREREDGG